MQANLALLFFKADVSYAKYPTNGFVKLVLKAIGEVTTTPILSAAAWLVSS